MFLFWCGRKSGRLEEISGRFRKFESGNTAALRSYVKFFVFTHQINDKGHQRIFTKLKDLKVKVDDNLFIFHHDQEAKEITLFEFYKIHSTIPKQMLFLGSHRRRINWIDCIVERIDPEPTNTCT